MIKFYNTLGRKREVFKPIKDKKVRIYVCGPTIYNYVHIGNLRAYIFADILRRYLEFSGFKIKEVMNLTDVDDKTIRESQKQGIELRKFTEKYKKAFLEDLKKLNIEIPEVLPCATEHIPEMVSMIKKLIKKGYAYKTEDGIYFSIKKFKDYGKLSGIKIKKLKAGASERVSKDEYDKKNINDFALWKFWDKEDGNVFWNTEIGKGRPGWHIECSAMSIKYLGQPFDIHTGGIDLIFPHHENEIAQSEAANNKKFVNYWMHNEWVLVNGRKMSKSLGNFYKLNDIIKKRFSPLDLRYLYLTKNYREKINFTWKNLQASKNALERLKNIISKINDDEKINQEYLKKFKDAMNNDLNTSKALQILWNLIRDKNAKGKINTIKEMDKVFGLNLFRKQKIKIPEEVQKLIKEREDAREKRDFKRADELRDKIKKRGYIIEDTPKGSVIRKI
ncbi:cysteine--tRNA ligase [Candidatus Pacearchaeota archaeon]|nr:MAG: cysteine--tRNA ligase [Candidatus Pacearchaeota archaeon]